MLSKRRSLISSDEDDDYELPSLSERIKASLALQSQKIHPAVHHSSDSEDEDSNFLKFSEKIQSTPCPQTKFSPKEINKEAEEMKAFRNEKKSSPPPVNIRLDFTSESEDEESQFSSLSQGISSSTPQVKPLGNFQLSSESDSDNEVFSKIQERLNLLIPMSENKENLNIATESDVTKKMSDFLKPLPPNNGNFQLSSGSDSDDEVFSKIQERLNLLTPMSENKENLNTAAESDVTKKMSNFLKPLPPNKKISHKAVDSESDESFSNFIEVLRTPLSAKKISQETVDSESDESFRSFIEVLRTPLSVKKISQRTVDSESDESFTSFVERLKTPMSINKKIQRKMIESDSDDSFLNNSRKQAFKTPKSQKKILKDAVLLPKITEKNHCHSSLMVEDTPNTVKTGRSEIEREFKMLFQQAWDDDARFLKERKSYTLKLYEFYNRKVFNSRLPPDLPLIYDGTLKTTAGMTHCSVKNGIHSCSKITLSPSVLITFDRLKETLLHEMCHAAVFIVNQQKVNHGPLWQVWASRCKLILPFIECPTRCHNYEISWSVWYQCPKCGWKKGKCKQAKKYHGALCRRCKIPIVMTRA